MFVVSTYQHDSYPLDKAITLRGSTTWVQVEPLRGTGGGPLMPGGGLFSALQVAGIKIQGQTFL